MCETRFVEVIRKRSAFVWEIESPADAARLVEPVEAQEQQVWVVVRNEHRRLPESNQRGTNGRRIAISHAPRQSRIVSDRFRRRSDQIDG